MEKSNQTDWTEQFISRLNSLSTGDRTALKRSLGVPLQEADARAWAAFYKVYLSENRRDEDACFITACAVSAFHNCVGPAIELPQRLKELSAESDSAENKFLQLLDVPLRENNYFSVKMGRILRLMLSKGRTIDFKTLLKDLQRWDHPDRYIQLRWARVFYGNPIEEINNTEKIDKENVEHAN